MAVIKFPSKCRDTVYDYRDVLNDYNRSSGEQQIIVDLSEVEFITPLGLDLISCIIEDSARSGKSVHYRAPQSPSVDRYLADVGFYDAFSIDGQNIRANPRSTSVKLRQLDRLNISYLENVPYWLRTNTPLDPEIIREVIQINLVEAIKNVLDHSQSPFGCYIAAQAYHNRTPASLVFCVMDFGVGFLANLQPFYPQIRDDVAALKAAVESGVSSKRTVERRARGVGLDVIRGFMQNMGRFQIGSRTGLWCQESGGSVWTQRLPFEFPGSFLLFVFEIEQLRRYGEERRAEGPEEFF